MPNPSSSQQESSSSSLLSPQPSSKTGSNHPTKQALWYLSWVLRSLLNKRGLVGLYVLNLTLGLLGYVVVESFRDSFSTDIKARSKTLLTSDLRISGRRSFSEQELARTDKILAGTQSKRAHMTMLYSMVAGPGTAERPAQSRLAQVRAVDRNYPLYGSFEPAEQVLTSEDGSVDRPVDNPAQPEQSVEALMKDWASIHAAPVAWVEQDLARQWKLKRGDTLRIGQQDYTVQRIIKQALGTARGGFNLAPSVYISLEQLEAAQLIMQGSSVWNFYFYAFPDQPDQTLIPRVSDWVDELKLALNEPGIEVTSFVDADRQFGLPLQIMNEYLALVSLAAFMLAGIGAAFLYRAFVQGQLYERALLLAIGCPPKAATRLALLEIVFMGVLGAAIACLLATLLLPYIGEGFRFFLPDFLHLRLTWRSLGAAFALACLGNLFLCLPTMRAAARVKPKILLEESSDLQISIQRSDLAWLLPGMVLLWLFCCYEVQSWQVGSLFYAALMLSAGVLYACAVFVLNRLSYRPASGEQGWRWPWHDALAHLNREPFAASIYLVAIVLASTLVGMLPNLKHQVEEEFRLDKDKAPSLFMFNIEDTQLDQLEDLIESRQATRSSLSPLIRARLSRINGKKASTILAEEKATTENQAIIQTREQENRLRFFNREFNLTYRENLDPATETITAGRPYQGSYDPSSGKLPEISLEFRFAERLGLKLGDVLEFDVLGVLIEGEVTSLRRIRWSSFQPNFFVQFQPGVLEEAPQSFVASIGPLPLQRKYALQDAIVGALPNISIVDVTLVMRRVLIFVELISWAVSLMALLCMAAGFVVLYSVCYQKVAHRAWDIGLLKALGASTGSIRASVMLEFGGLSLVACCLGQALAAGFAMGLSHLAFGRFSPLGWGGIFAMILAIWLCAMLAIFFASFQALRTKPRLLLQ